MSRTRPTVSRGVARPAGATVVLRAVLAVCLVGVMAAGCGGSSSGGGYEPGPPAPTTTPPTSEPVYTSPDDDTGSFSGFDESPTETTDPPYVSDDSSDDAGVDSAEGASGPEPYGSSSAGVWYSPGANQFTSDMIWSFDLGGTGCRRDYQPSGIGGPVQRQSCFAYDPAGTQRYLLSYTATGSLQQLDVLDYDSSSDVLHVAWEGYDQYWYGCSSSQLPIFAQAACTSM